MDQLTHTVRRSNWINIIRQCQDRPAGTTAKQWLAENDISEKSYYYWLRKIRREVCEQEELQKVTNPSALSFVEIPVKTALDIAPVPTVPATMMGMKNKAYKYVPRNNLVNFMPQEFRVQAVTVFYEAGVRRPFYQLLFMPRPEIPLEYI